MQRRIATWGVLVTLITTGIYFFPERPLFRSRDTLVEASLNGTPIEAAAFTAAFVPERTYIHIQGLTACCPNIGGVRRRDLRMMTRPPQNPSQHAPRDLGNTPLTNGLYAWFGINWKHGIVGASGRPYERIPGIRTVNKSGPIGIGLLTPKIEDDWKVDINPNGIAFSNGTLQVTVHRR